MKKTIIGLLILISLISLIACKTFAIFVAKEKTTNVITTGNVKIELFQKTIDKNGKIVDLDTDRLVEIVPDSTFTQMPYIKNIGTEDCYTRVYLQTKILAKDGKIVLPDKLDFNINDSKWVLDSEGWYRYKDVLKVGQTTLDPLFTTITFSKDMDNSYIGSNMQVKIIAQAVQSEHNDYENSVLEIDGWGDTANAISEVNF